MQPQIEDSASDSEIENEIINDEEEFGAGLKDSIIDDAMLNELFLVCSNLGIVRINEDTAEGNSHTGTESKFVRSEDCVAWIHDLQRAIRRDDAATQHIALKLGSWQVLQKKLLPLFMNHSDDWYESLNIVMIDYLLGPYPFRF